MQGFGGTRFANCRRRMSAAGVPQEFEQSSSGVLRGNKLNWKQYDGPLRNRTKQYLFLANQDSSGSST